MSDPLFACTKCHHKFPFGKLSGSLMQCPGCQEESSKLLGPTVCTYCREEYTGGDDSSTICPKCQANVKQYGKPRACEICNIIAAFIGSKCKRCVVSEDKWGSPVTCEQCKQKCAFNREDHSKRKVDRKVLCWLCTIAYKRVLAKTRKKENSSSYGGSESQSHKRKTDSATLSSSKSRISSRPDKQHSSSNSSSLAKKMKHSASTGNLNGSGTTGKSKETVSDSTTSYMHDMNIVLVTQLREEVESLKKTLAAKERELLDKERKMTEFKTLKMETDKAHREKIEVMQKRYTTTTDALQTKNNELLKQIATLSKATRRGGVSSTNTGSNQGSPATR